MKRCPECRRDYYDETLSFCLDDGTRLVDGPASMDEPATAILSEPGAIATGFPHGEDRTRPQINTTDQTATFPRSAGAEPQGSLRDLSERPSLSAHRAAKPQGNRTKPFMFAGLAALLLVGGFFGYRYFAPTSKQIESVAVLPFVNESSNDDNEYLSDGMTESLIGSLSQLPNLSVKARASVFRYKGKEIDPRRIGQELSVQAILTGRVVQRGNDLTLYVELIDAATENVLWKADYSRSMSNLVSLQSDVAKDVSSKLKTKLSGADELQITKTYTANPEAYKLYLQGLYHWHKRTPEDIRRSIALFQQATEKDPSYAQAYAGLALGYSVLPFNSDMSKQEAKEVQLRERAALSKAQELDDSLPEVHLELGTFKRNDWDFAAAEKEFRRAIELNPNYATARQWYSEFLSYMGRHEEAFAEINKAHEIDPFSRAVNGNIGLRFYEARSGSLPEIHIETYIG